MKTEGRHRPLHGLILAGGRSSRMGMDKALLPIDGMPLLERLVLQMLALTDSVTIAAGTEERASIYREALSGCREELAAGKVRFVADAYPGGNGPLAGLHAGLSAIPRGYAFVMACDMPAVSGVLLEQLLEAIDGGRAEADVVHAAGQPFHALYHTRVAGAVAEALENRDYRVMGLLGRLKTTVVPLAAGSGTESDGAGIAEAEEGLRNLNTPEDYRNYLNNLIHHQRMRRDET
ncbi:molybdenum cofactor guanylyltransferase [Paenibacillus soyae]|uniref:Probable molybdenum cofactor guanylyltransferase n=1 Tax=Paenibacillus soyae TaxID=2969249 RepID=A0A9X2MVJ6_9BACL|nr:molybdenum cofactor guanylyltransferase [Paenibacillus soyae]MCR2807836.1 molybdenum cofactor guanylyltransferase [Paenibacillus soyae]